jgi:hypothetical protein
MRSVASDGGSPDVWRKRSDKESCPKNFPEAKSSGENGDGRESSS